MATVAMPWILIAFFASNVAGTQRQPMPDAVAISRAKAVVLDAYRGDIDSDPAKAVRTLIDASRESDGDADMAAMLLVASDVATRSGELRLAFESFDEIGRRFDFDSLAEKIDILEDAARIAHSASMRVVIVNRSLELIDESIRSERYDIGERAAKVAQSIVGKLRDPELRRGVAENRRELDRKRKAHDATERSLADARMALSRDPGNAAANEIIGKHLCFDKNDWLAGLKHLSKSADKTLQVAALSEITGATEPQQQDTLAGWWWSLAEHAESKRDEFGYRSRAVFWYSKAVSDLSGASKARAEKRLKEAVDALAKAALQQGSDGGKYIDVALAPGVTMRLVRISGSADGKIRPFYLGQTEVTQKQWKAVMPSHPEWENAGDSIAAGNLTYKDACAFVAAVNRSSAGLRFSFSLPNSDELAVAWFSGLPDGYAKHPVTDYAWVKESSPDDDRIREVATKKPNSLGVYDIPGNCWEWITEESLFGGATDTPSDVMDGRLPISGNEKGKRYKTFGVRVAADVR